ncbi:hypothetical protein D3C85_1832290 [compost metagenome]
MLIVIEAAGSISVMVQLKQVGSTGQLIQGVGSVEVAVIGEPVGGVPLTVAKL